MNGDIEHQNLNGNSIKEKELPNEKENFQVSFKLISDGKVLVKNVRLSPFFSFLLGG